LSPIRKQCCIKFHKEGDTNVINKKVTEELIGEDHLANVLNVVAFGFNTAGELKRMFEKLGKEPKLLHGFYVQAIIKEGFNQKKRTVIDGINEPMMGADDTPGGNKVAITTVRTAFLNEEGKEDGFHPGYISPRTFSHEIGHALSLVHPDGPTNDYLMWNDVPKPGGGVRLSPESCWKARGYAMTHYSYTLSDT
jgi:hypothetical protein